MRHGSKSVWQLDFESIEEARCYLGLISKHWRQPGTLRKLVEE
jgi:hypothetical protein